jgi:hypothetical protein
MGITIYPSEKLKKKLKDISQKEKRSMNNLILFILEKYIESLGEPKNVSK